jgi:antitoxin MazE
LQAHFQTWGYNLGARIPRSLAEDVEVRHGSEVRMSVLERELIVKPAFSARFKLDDLLVGITPANLHSAVDIGEAVGVETF